ncbi:helix-turn-helix domain-containing protein [Cryobacterium sp. SO2]|uniref:winged helix-turn-helix transcriptional regulator n=1 Tax=Cryobacterium sp. SO2 TaxID=1897060 RepID=UPI00223CCD10|nr:helix-turn-helix domain-containing protein [Cryobacterium sp. SO2]WEO76356.1 helix-turn-helix domain-containing protein [Cryobacterium sp. SO2]
MTVVPAETGVTFDTELETQCAVPAIRSLVRDVFTMTGDRWSMPVIRALNDGPVRFGHLMVAVEGISHRMLTRTLRALERDGLVTRISYPESPPRVEYELTGLGDTLREPVRAFIQWTQDHRAEIERSRVRFDG